MRRRSLSCARVVAALAIVGVGARASEPEVSVTAALDRTAMWVADRVIYTIELTCRRGVEVLADDLSSDKLKLDGLEVIEGETTHRTTGDRTVYRFRYVLTTYRVDLPTRTIAPLTVRYAIRRAGQPLAATTPAAEVQVPGTAIAFRSVLPDDPGTATLRSDKPSARRGPIIASLRPIGVGLIIVSVVPALVALTFLLRHVRRPRARRRAGVVRQAEHASLETARTMPTATIEQRREVFARLSALVRDHLHHVCGVPGASLTPAEIAPALSNGATRAPAELVTSVLAACDRARYAPPEAVPSSDACREAIEQVEQIIGPHW